MREDREVRYLRYISDAIRRIEERTASGRDLFLADDVLQGAVIRRLETFADATRHLSKELRDRHTELPWREISDFRNRVAHGYLDVNLNLVWRIIEEGFPPLKAVVEQELGDQGHGVA